jgi:hypothetical protein
MTTAALAVCASVLCVAVAARSTWSPCGLSMLATITPLAERGRGHRYRSAAAWFVAGGLAGGLTLGVVDGGLAALVRATAAAPIVLAVVALTASVVTLLAELGLGRLRLPAHHRQVNERWLDRFRTWVYAGGFGWQVGTGLATYIMTPALYLMIVLAALTATPWAAAAVATSFGLLRGLAVLLGWRITDTDRLRTFHRRFHDAEPPVRRALVAVEGAVVLTCAWAVSPWAALVLLLTVIPLAAARLRVPSKATARPG